METREHVNRWLIFLLVATGVFLSTMDSSMINVALPSIMRTFSTTLARTQWVVLMYLLTITVSLLIWGYMADCYGQGRIYLLGMLVFTFGSAVCYYAPTLSLLIFFRFVQALGAAMMMASGPAIIKNIFPRENLGRALGLLGIATSIGLMSGPVISGLLISYFSWRSVFLVTVPVSLAVYVLGELFLVRNLPKRNKTGTTPFDWYGGLGWIVLVSLLVLFISHAQEIGLVSKIISAVLLGGIAWSFLTLEKRHDVPLFPLFLFRKKYYEVAMIAAALSFVVLFMVLILMPFYMDYILRIQADKIGYVMMAVPLTLFIVSPVSGWLYDSIGSRILTTAGLTISCIAVIWLSLLKPESTPVEIACRLALLGMGQSIFLSPNTASVLARIEMEHTGITSGMLATSRNIGMLIGVAIAGTAFAAFFSFFSGGLDLKEYSSIQVKAFIQAFRSTLEIAALLAMVAAILSALRE